MSHSYLITISKIGPKVTPSHVQPVLANSVIKVDFLRKEFKDNNAYQVLLDGHNVGRVLAHEDCNPFDVTALALYAIEDEDWFEEQIVAEKPPVVKEDLEPVVYFVTPENIEQ